VTPGDRVWCDLGAHAAGLQAPPRVPDVVPGTVVKVVGEIAIVDVELPSGLTFSTPFRLDVLRPRREGV